jgi:hypothetical protein
VIRAAFVSVRPVLDLIELPFRKWQLANLNPMAPHLHEIVLRIADLERRATP